MEKELSWKEKESEAILSEIPSGRWTLTFGKYKPLFFSACRPFQKLGSMTKGNYFSSWRFWGLVISLASGRIVQIMALGLAWFVQQAVPAYFQVACLAWAVQGTGTGWGVEYRSRISVTTQARALRAGLGASMAQPMLSLCIFYGLVSDARQRWWCSWGGIPSSFCACSVRSSLDSNATS